MTARWGSRVDVRREARTGVLVLAATAALLASSDGALAADSGDYAVSRYSAIVTVVPDGSIEVSETITFDFSGGSTDSVQRTFSVQEAYDAEADRVYELTDVAVDVGESPADVDVSSADGVETLSIDFAEEQSGELTLDLSYTVDGVVASTVDGLEVRWPVVQGFGVPVNNASVEWNAPNVLWLSCLAGSPGSSRPCTTAQLAEVASPTMTQLTVEPGEQLVGILGLGAGSGVEASGDLEPRRSLARSFTATGAELWVAVGCLVLGLLAALALWWRRGRDSRPGGAGSSAPLLADGDGGVLFAPPSGVRPGQMGTLVDERVDIVDVSSTIIDLATRNYLFIEELPHDHYGRMDWLLRRRNDPGDELLGYERGIFEAVFADSAEVRVSELDSRLRDRLAVIQASMYEDMVAQGWFAERPDAARNRWTTAGWVLIAAGVVLAAVLALTGTFGLLGLAVVMAGAALALAGQLAPARTARGAEVLAALKQFRRYLERAEMSDLPARQREELISRFYPYALVFGFGERWAEALAATDDDPDPDEPVYWYGAPRDWHLSDAAPSLGHLSTSLNAVISSRHLLSD